jgi:hypothetical protein
LATRVDVELTPPRGQALGYEENMLLIRVVMALYKGVPADTATRCKAIVPIPLSTAITKTSRYLRVRRYDLKDLVDHWLECGEVQYAPPTRRGNGSDEYKYAHKTLGAGEQKSIDEFITGHTVDHGFVTVMHVVTHVHKMYNLEIPKSTMEIFLKRTLGYERVETQKKGAKYWSLTQSPARRKRIRQFLLSYSLCKILCANFDYVMVFTDESYQHQHSRVKHTLAKHGYVIALVCARFVFKICSHT